MAVPHPSDEPDASAPADAGDGPDVGPDLGERPPRARESQERAMAWTILVIAALLEPVWAIALERSDGFRRLGPTALGVVAATASFVLLSLSLRHLPVGTAYAVWVGIGATGVAAVGMVALGESASPLRLVFLATIVVGVAGLRALDA